MRTLILMLAIAGCGKDVSFDTLETARAQVKENAEYNAQEYRRANQLAECSIYARGDSTQQPDCPQGDGWASIELRCPAKTEKLKCSTVSVALGCMTDLDFKSREYAKDDGKCQPTTKVPHPIRKLVK